MRRNWSYFILIFNVVFLVALALVYLHFSTFVKKGFKET